jgi:UDP-N-acetylmuramate--alanine ligase
MKVHFIGIGGIGMSALALLALKRGDQVSGSDLRESPITVTLEKLGAKIGYGQQGSSVDQEAVVVVSTAIDRNNSEYVACQKQGLKIYHRSEFLSLMMKNKKPIMVSGAHGKTTTTALLVHIFKTAGLKPSYAIGGQVPEYPHADFDEGEHFIFEGDESDGSFLKANPVAAIFTNIDQEHLDYWKTFEQLIQGFKEAILKIEDPKKVFLSSDDRYLKQMREEAIYFGFEQKAKLSANSIVFTKEGMQFNLVEDQETFACQLSLFGEHNIKNALGCYGVARAFGIPKETILTAFQTFLGVKRRFEMIGKVQSTTFVDDYAHHPVEIAAVLKVLKEISPLEKILVVFQPHRYSRFSSLLDEFIQTLSQPLSLLVLPVYAANEKQIDGLMEKFLTKVRSREVFFVEFGEVESFLTANYQKYDWVITLGAGNVTSIGRNFLKSFSDDTKVLC